MPIFVVAKVIYCQYSNILTAAIQVIMMPIFVFDMVIYNCCGNILTAAIPDTL